MTIKARREQRRMIIASPTPGLSGPSSLTPSSFSSGPISSYNLLIGRKINDRFLLSEPVIRRYKLVTFCQDKENIGQQYWVPSESYEISLHFLLIFQWQMLKSSREKIDYCFINRITMSIVVLMSCRCS